MPKNLARIQKAKKRRTQYGGQYVKVLAPVRIVQGGTDVSKNTLD